jgi:hypothetical protein
MFGFEQTQESGIFQDKAEVITASLPSRRYGLQAEDCKASRGAFGHQARKCDEFTCRTQGETGNKQVAAQIDTD